jgi:hypothetical protein
MLLWGNLRIEDGFFSFVALCVLVWVYERYRGLYCLHHQGDHRPDDGSSTNLWNVGKLIPATLHYNPEASHLHTHHHENIKSYYKFDKCLRFMLIFVVQKLIIGFIVLYVSLTNKKIPLNPTSSLRLKPRGSFQVCDLSFCNILTKKKEFYSLGYVTDNSFRAAELIFTGTQI